MGNKNFFQKTSVKIILVTLSFVLMLAIGAIPVWVVLNMDQTLFIRILIGLIGPVWAALTIGYISFRTNYPKLWHRLRHEQKRKKVQEATSQYPEYLLLKEKYPLSIRRHEQHCQHHKIPADEMMESALKVSEEEWSEREAFRREAYEERHGSSGPDRRDGSLV